MYSCDNKSVFTAAITAVEIMCHKKSNHTDLMLDKHFFFLLLLFIGNRNHLKYYKCFTVIFEISHTPNLNSSVCVCEPLVHVVLPSGGSDMGGERQYI